MTTERNDYDRQARRLLAQAKRDEALADACQDVNPGGAQLLRDMAARDRAKAAEAKHFAKCLRVAS